MLVWPVAIHTCAPEGMGIIAAASPSSLPLPDREWRHRKYASKLKPDDWHRHRPRG
jgi:hypothetical protein